AFKQLYDKGLIYEGSRVLPYSWAAETPVSNFETRMDNSYRERADPALTVRFALEPKDGDPGPMDLWVWTTTPWTLPSNLAAAVGPEIEYALLEKDGRIAVVGAAAAAKYERELEGAVERGKLLGKDLVGRAYQPPFDYFKGHPGAHVILEADFVDTEEGTGVVHMAPGFGEDDQRICEAHGIELVVPVDDRGEFTAEITDYQGQNVLEANKPIAADLKAKGLVVRHEQYLHNYPHCWRTDQPLIYRAMPSWYVEVTRFRERMVELNQEIRWIPEHVKDGQFGKWLAGARDWSISRNRFWGTPIPVWQSDDPKYPRTDVYGSLDELERDFGVRPTDLHRPFIDELVRPNPDDPTGKSMMRRVPDVLDCWFESGSMPFAQVHYPFENKDWFESHFPADYIVEYVSQTRGWFYTLMVLGTALFDRPPFKNCICHGVIVAEDGQKLSKRLRNYPPPEETFAKHGSDALRWHLMSAPVLRGGDMSISQHGAEFGEVVRLVLNPIWNAWSFFSLYANADGLRGQWNTGSKELLDRYALAKAGEFVECATCALDNYDIAGACAEVRAFLEALNNWYIRRSRPRFWSSDKDASKQAAYDTLYTCLHVLCRVCAPLLPHVADEVFCGLTGGESLHLQPWPERSELPNEPELVQQMDAVRELCSVSLGLREERRLRVRLPLAKLVVAGPGADALEPYFDLVRDEVNVKTVETSSEVEAFARFELKVNARAVGPRLGGRMKAVMAASKQGKWERGPEGTVIVDGETLNPGGEFELVLKPGEQTELAVAGLPSGELVAALDVQPGPELEREGVARDLVRLIQQARKAADFDVSDRIRLSVECADGVWEAYRAHAGYVDDQVLATAVERGAADGATSVQEFELLDAPVRMGLSRA
ncbi:MAG: isoleucine--tRNA ligase, partial [Planctomycetota bacterium]